MEGSSLDSSVDQESLDVYAEKAFDLADEGSACYFRWTLAGTTLALTGDEFALRRYVLPSLGSDIQKVSSPPPGNVYHIHWAEVGMAKERIIPPKISNECDIEMVADRRIWLSDRVRIEYQVREDILTLADLSKGRALVQLPSRLSALPYYEQAAPIRGLLHGIMPLMNLRLFHAAVIGRSQAGVLLAGRGGSGKSSAALVGLIAGMHYVGDDYVLIDNGHEPCAYGLYATAKVARADLSHGTPVDATVLNPCGTSSEKAVFRLNPEPDGFRSGLPLKALLVPRIGGSTMRIESCSAARALASLAPSTLLQMAGEREALFTHCTRLARQLPAFILHTGPRTAQYPQDIARTIDQLLEKIGSSRDQIET